MGTTTPRSLRGESVSGEPVSGEALPATVAAGAKAGVVVGVAPWAGRERGTVVALVGRRAGVSAPFPKWLAGGSPTGSDLSPALPHLGGGSWLPQPSRSSLAQASSQEVH